ncbi:hypothetical protein DFA_07749 [Cavenderia fasciculata]|uniref:Uncharacterized protein n=1 Tax=Cavenderia fasciculata TaxID=261658 RepID=F4Q349_CACFS|nr:uncharacterized protein DFA_07749 [Cavenderia fasciculata]EGG16771.1 hypothetical protein DFA_07749 [Cavenderia fasciculata]|eukprot:XP_004355245.1 hypothetical protein DFA_07749 [Cavenderia fasciculata]
MPPKKKVTCSVCGEKGHNKKSIKCKDNPELKTAADYDEYGLLHCCASLFHHKHKKELRQTCPNPAILSNEFIKVWTKIEPPSQKNKPESYGDRCKCVQNHCICGLIEGLSDEARNGAFVSLNSPSLMTAQAILNALIDPRQNFATDVVSEKHLETKYRRQMGINIGQGDIRKKFSDADKVMDPSDKLYGAVIFDTMNTLKGNKFFRPLDAIKDILKSRRMIEGGLLTLTICRRGNVKDAHKEAHRRLTKMAFENGYRLEMKVGTDKNPGDRYTSEPKRGRTRGSNMVFLAYTVHSLTEPNL